MHRRSFASKGTLPKATRRARKRVHGNAEAWVSTLQEIQQDGFYRGNVRGICAGWMRDMSTYMNAEVNPDGTPIPPYHKGFPALATIPRHGRIGLQGIHNTEAAVHFKYLKVNEIK